MFSTFVMAFIRTLVNMLAFICESNLKDKFIFSDLFWWGLSNQHVVENSTTISWQMMDLPRKYKYFAAKLLDTYSTGRLKLTSTI